MRLTPDGLGVGRVRRHGRLTTPEVLAAEMPAELNLLEFCGTVEGLRAEFRKISVWIDEQVPGRGDDLLLPLLRYIGFDFGEWYRKALQHDSARGFWSQQQ